MFGAGRENIAAEEEELVFFWFGPDVGGRPRVSVIGDAIGDAIGDVTEEAEPGQQQQPDGGREREREEEMERDEREEEERPSSSSEETFRHHGTYRSVQ